MIYESPLPDGPIRQGDMFFGLPRIDVALNHLAVYNRDGTREALSWSAILENGEPTDIIVSVKPVTAIVISQDCDTEREPHISLCEIREFTEVYPPSKGAAKPDKWINLITQHSRKNQKWFYLPEDRKHGLHTRMGVDFFLTMRVSLQDLRDYLHLRRARLNETAKAHFRERIAEFFRRYPYDEWYPLNQAEFAAYRGKYPDAVPFSWQQ